MGSEMCIRDRLKGGFSKELKTLRDELLKMTSLMELELEISEEDVEFASRRARAALLDGGRLYTSDAAGENRVEE